MEELVKIEEPDLLTFSELGVPTFLSAVLDAQNIHQPTAIQRATVPDAISGRDVLGRGRTGSGKTLAFLLPLVARLQGGPRPSAGAPRALILAPTRELAGQIEAVLAPLAAAAELSCRTVFGGVGHDPQIRALRRGVDIVVACPGRLEDLIAERHCSLRAVEITVLDEADHMADLGFLPAVRRLLAATPAGGQRMLFSATLDNAVDDLVRRFLPHPAVHEVDPERSPVSVMDHHVLHVEVANRMSVMLDLIGAPGRSVVFTRTKHGAAALAARLVEHGVPALALHGNLRQNVRVRNLEAFHSGRAAVLVATDIAARGIHVDDVRMVIHADPPADHKAYLHRSGRTARAGNSGSVVTFVTTSQLDEVAALTRAAGIRPTTTRVSSADHPLLAILAPGERAVHRPARTADATGPVDAGDRTEEPARKVRRGSHGTAGRSVPTVSATTHSAAAFSARRRVGQGKIARRNSLPAAN